MLLRLRFRGLTFFEFGTSNVSEASEKKQIRICNFLSFYFILMTVPFFPLFFWLGEKVCAFGVILVVLNFGCCILFNRLGWVMLSRVWLVLTSYITLFCYGGMLGEFGAMQYVFILMAGVPYCIFGPEYSLIRYSLVLLAPLLYICEYIFGFPFFYHTLMPVESIRFVGHSVFMVATSIQIATLSYLTHQYERSKSKLKKMMHLFQITERETEIIFGVISGQSNKEIATHLFIEEGTVKSHLKTIFKKLSVKSRLELVVLFQ